MPARDRSAGPSLLVQCLTVSLFAGLLVLDIWIFLIRGHGPLQAKVELLLEILAFYTFMFGFLAQTGILDHFEDLIRDMTSPNLYEFLRANPVFLTILFSTLACGPGFQKDTVRTILPAGAVIAHCGWVARDRICYLPYCGHRPHCIPALCDGLCTPQEHPGIRR